MIRFWQHYYTSCVKGLGYTPGFQTKARSPEIEDWMLPVLESASAYDLPYGSNDVAIDMQPISLSAFPINKKYHCLSVIHYVEFNFERRPDVFFAHNLVCLTEDLRQIGYNPFCIFRRMDCFKKDDPVERLDLESISIEPDDENGEETWDNLRAYLSMEEFNDLFTAIIYAQKVSRPIILVASQEKIKTILEAVLLLLPFECRSQFSFTTYRRNPKTAKFMVCGTVGYGKSEFEFSSEHYNYQYFIFDFERKKYSPLNFNSKYGTWITKEIYSSQYKNIADYIRFSEDFKLDFDPIQLDIGIDLFCLPDSIKQFDFNSGIPSHIRPFTENQFIPKDSISKFTNVLIGAIDSILESNQVEMAFSALSLLLAMLIKFGVEETEFYALADRYYACFKIACQNKQFQLANQIWQELGHLSIPLKKIFLNPFFDYDLLANLKLIGLNMPGFSTIFVQEFLVSFRHLYPDEWQAKLCSLFEILYNGNKGDGTTEAFSFWWPVLFPLLQQHLLQDERQGTLDNISAINISRHIVSKLPPQISTPVMFSLSLPMLVRNDPAKLSRLKAVLFENYDIFQDNSVLFEQIIDILECENNVLYLLARFYEQNKSEKYWRPLLEMFFAYKRSAEFAEVQGCRQRMYAHQDTEILRHEFRQSISKCAEQPGELNPILQDYLNIFQPPQKEFYRQCLPELIQFWSRTIGNNVNPYRVEVPDSKNGRETPERIFLLSCLGLELLKVCPYDYSFSRSQIEWINAWLDSSPIHEDSTTKHLIAKARIIIELFHAVSHKNQAELIPDKLEDLKAFKQNKYSLTNQEFNQIQGVILENLVIDNIAKPGWNTVKETLTRSIQPDTLSNLVNQGLKINRQQPHYIDLLSMITIDIFWGRNNWKERLLQEIKESGINREGFMLFKSKVTEELKEQRQEIKSVNPLWRHHRLFMDWINWEELEEQFVSNGKAGKKDRISFLGRRKNG